MVTVNFRLTDIGSIELPLAEKKSLATVIQLSAAKAGVELGGIIAIRQGKVLKESDLVEDRDEIDVFPAISGG